MKTRSMIAAALALSFAGATAFAQSGEATYDYPQPISAAKSRAEVKAELAQARANGEVQIGEAGTPQPRFTAQRSRADVKAQARAAVAGDLHDTTHEAYAANGAFVAPRTVSAPLLTAGK